MRLLLHPSTLPVHRQISDSDCSFPRSDLVAAEPGNRVRYLSLAFNPQPVSHHFSFLVRGQHVMLDADLSSLYVLKQGH